MLGVPGWRMLNACKPTLERDRVHPDGRVEGWAIGKDDTLADSPPLLIDTWEWPSSVTKD